MIDRFYHISKKGVMWANVCDSEDKNNFRALKTDAQNLCDLLNNLEAKKE